MPLSSISLLNNTGHLLIPRFFYWNFKKLLEISNKRPNQIVNYWVRPSLPIILSKSLNSNLLATFDNLEKNINFGEIDDKLVLEVAANQVFFKENTLSYLIFNSNSNFDFNENNSIKPIF